MAGPPEEGGNRPEGGGTRPGDIFDAQDLKALQVGRSLTLTPSDDKAREATNPEPNYHYWDGCRASGTCLLSFWRLADETPLADAQALSGFLRKAGVTVDDP